MKVQIGKLYNNKTSRFLYPCLKGHGDEFVKMLNSTFKLAMGIHDSVCDGSSLADGKNMYIMFDKKHNPQEFKLFLEWIKMESYYKGDYCPEAKFETSRKHMIIIEVPERFHTSYDYFLQGKYSLMYTQEDLDILFKNARENRSDDYNILMRSHKASKNFEAKLKEEFGDIVSFESKEVLEYDLPLKKSEEIFNCKVKQTVFFNELIDKTWQ